MASSPTQSFKICAMNGTLAKIALDEASLSGGGTNFRRFIGKLCFMTCYCFGDSGADEYNSIYDYKCKFKLSLKEVIINHMESYKFMKSHITCYDL